MTSTQDGGRFGLWTVLVITATVASAAAAGAWAVARAYVQDELEQYRRSAEWRLPETLNKLREVSDKLAPTLDERKELELLRVEVKTLRDGNAKLQAATESAQQSLATLTKQIADLQGDTFEVQKGQAHFVVPGVVAVGVKDTRSYNGEADIQFAGTTHTATPGTSFESMVDGTKYTVTLLRIDSSSCTFAVSKKLMSNPPSQPTPKEGRG